MKHTREDYLFAAKRLYIVGVIVYCVHFATESWIMTWIFSPELEAFSRPLALSLRFIDLEIRGLTAPPLASICIIAGLMLHPTLTSLIGREDK